MKKGLVVLRNLQVIFLRHGEKPTPSDNDSDVSGDAMGDNFIGLSPAGWERARKLPNFLLGNDIIKHPDKVRIIAMKQKVDEDDWSGRSRRPIETVLFLADRLSLGLNTKYKKEDYSVAEDILHNKQYDNSTVVICWEHDDLAKMIIKAFKPKIEGVDESVYHWKKPKEGESAKFDFSRTIILYYNAKGKMSLEIRDQDDPNYLWTPDSAK
jgi:hypothetical protein